ncbi:hypothetical protein DFH06DRAFT_1262085, partial [Mycena polygramma]
MSAAAPPPSADLPAREQCLQNPDLIAEILGHLFDSSRLDHVDRKAERCSLLCSALMCRAMSPSAVKLLWRRLDNLVPLLRLLPSFTRANEIYGLLGNLNTPDSQLFDHHAAYVQEIVYKRVPDTIQIDPSVYLRLSLRNPPVLPNLRRLVCSGAVPPSAAEIVVLMQSPLRVLGLQVTGHNVNDGEH